MLDKVPMNNSLVSPESSRDSMGSRSSRHHGHIMQAAGGGNRDDSPALAG